MMKVPVLLRTYIDGLFRNQDPIDAAKNMVSSIQQLVGIHNVFGDKDRNFSTLSIFAMVVFGGAFLYVGTLSQLVYLMQVFPDKVETFKALNCLSATSVPISKFIFMLTVRSRLKVIFDMSRQGLSLTPSGSSARSKMLTTLRRASYASWLVVLNQALSHVIFLLVPFTFTVFGNDRYLPTTPGDSYGLSPKYETPFYEITFALTTAATIFSAVNQTGYIVLFVTLLAYELGHFYSITETLNDINATLRRNMNNGTGERKSVDEKLKLCVIHHQFLIKFHHKIRELYKVIFGAHFLMMTIVIVTTLQTLNEWDIRNTILTSVTGIMPLFIYCFGGELLISARTEMSTAIYTSGWELMEVKQAKVVLLMLSLSQRPLYLTAADIFIMNMQTFGNVAQVVYKIYAVFN